MTTPTTALVTGASRGIGRAIAQRLAADGFTVIINYARDGAAAQDTVAEITTAGGKAIALQADVSDPQQLQRLFAEAVQAAGPLAAIVHNAGILPMANIELTTIESFDQCVAVNLRSTFLLMGHAREHLSADGRFVALSSSVLARNFPGYGPYIASKAGVEGLVRVFANELRGRQITANAVAPGPVATELFFKGKTPEQIAQLAAMNPLERLGEPEDIANTVAFLCSQDGGWVNGQVLRANGGFA
tara:strand:- start:1517 stop:2251 length:735 start_codon:yes stop_codon:yes gene_type:complete